MLRVEAAYADIGKLPRYIDYINNANLSSVPLVRKLLGEFGFSGEEIAAAGIRCVDTKSGDAILL